jgi:hypothetical protein
MVGKTQDANPRSIHITAFLFSIKSVSFSISIQFLFLLGSFNVAFKIPDHKESNDRIVSHNCPERKNTTMKTGQHVSSRDLNPGHPNSPFLSFNLVYISKI